MRIKYRLLSYSDGVLNRLVSDIITFFANNSPAPNDN